VFRKTTLQPAPRGEDINRSVADDARVSGSVMMTNDVRGSDPEMRLRRHRTDHRTAASLPPELARRYGHVEIETNAAEQRLQDAITAKDWGLVAGPSAALAGNG
jgi:hypothetical protein